MSHKPCKEERVSRVVIENKLLASLTENSDQVAALLTKEDVELLMDALFAYDTIRNPKPKAVEMAQDLRQLLIAAFPK